MRLLLRRQIRAWLPLRRRVKLARRSLPVAVLRVLDLLVGALLVRIYCANLRVAVLLSLVALLASYIPARRPMRLDPNTALRYE